jgi:hypothetical protein
LRAALADRPVVLLHGARQTGKTPLARGGRGSLPGTEVNINSDWSMTTARAGVGLSATGLMPFRSRTTSINASAAHGRDQSSILTPPSISTPAP